MSRFGEGPGAPYKAMIDGLWPQLGDEDPRQYLWDVAYHEVTTRTIAYRDPDTGLLSFVPRGQPDPLRGPDVRPLLRITCVARLHNLSRPPTLAEVWQTSHGLLYVAKLPGRLLDPREDGGDPFDPPAAVRNRRSDAASSRSHPTCAIGGWQHVPITIVRLLLADDVPAALWVRCVDHSSAEVDRVKLFREYELHLASGGADTPEPRYVPLDSVVALSSD